MENKYKIIVDYIEHEIYNSNFKSKLPSIRALAIKFNCSNSTVIRAYSELEKKRLIYSMPKSGYFVLENGLFKENNLINDNLDFYSGEPNESIFPTAQFQKYIDLSINTYGSSLFTYGGCNGFSPLKSTFCKKYKNIGLNLKEEYTHFSNGAQQAITLLSLMDFKNDKKSILVESPSYNIYLAWLNLIHCKVHTIERNKDGINLNVLEALFKNHDIKFFYTIPRFHNPLGTSYDEDTKKQIIYLANKYNVYIVEDDYLSELAESSNKPLKYYDEFEKVIYLKSYSKLLLPGARLATIVLPEKLSEDFKQFKNYYELKGNHIFQCALNEYIKSNDYDKYMDNLKIHYRNKMTAMKKVIDENSSINIDYTYPNNGLFSLIKMPFKFDINDFISTLKGKKVYIRHGRYFYYEKDNNVNTIRLSVAKCNESEIYKGMSIFFDTLKDMIKSNTFYHSDILEL